MPEVKTRVFTKVNGEDRLLYTLIQTTKNDLHIRLNSGKFSGPYLNLERIKQERFTIHPSNKSKYYNTISIRHESENNIGSSGKNTHKETYLTNSVKSKNGFCQFVLAAHSDLKDGCYDFKRSGNCLYVPIPDFDPKQCSLFTSLCIGYKDVPFNHYEPNVGQIELFFGDYKLVLLYLYFIKPAFNFSTIFHASSEGKIYPPDKLVDTSEKAHRCAKVFSVNSGRLLNMQWTKKYNPQASRNLQNISKLHPSLHGELMTVMLK